MAASGLIARRALIGGLVQLAALRTSEAGAVPHSGRLVASDEIRFEFPQESSIICGVEVNGVPTRGLIDTGSTLTVIGAALARRLGLEGSDPLTSAGGVKLIQLLRLPAVELGIGGQCLNISSAVCVDLGPLSGPHGDGPELIVGLDLLRRVGLHFNFSSRTLTVCSSARLLPVGERLDVYSGSLGEASINIVANGVPFQAMVDTGNANALVASPDAGQRLRSMQTEVSDALAVGADGLVEESVFSVRELRIGASRLTDVPVGELQGWRAPVPLLVGLPTLSQFELFLDLGANIISLRPDRARQQSGLLHDLSGLGLKLTGDRLVVVHLARGGPGLEAALAIGDEIVAVDGQRIGPGYNQGGLWRWRYTDAPAVARLILADGRTKVLKLRRYY